jgi:surface antigen
VKKAIKDLMDRKQKRADRKARKKALNYNPYFTPFNGRGTS